MTRKTALTRGEYSELAQEFAHNIITAEEVILRLNEHYEHNEIDFVLCDLFAYRQRANREVKVWCGPIKRTKVDPNSLVPPRPAYRKGQSPLDWSYSPKVQAVLTPATKPTDFLYNLTVLTNQAEVVEFENLTWSDIKDLLVDISLIADYHITRQS